MRVCWFMSLYKAYNTACFTIKFICFFVVKLTFDFIWLSDGIVPIPGCCRTITPVPRTCNVTCSMWWWERTVEDMSLDNLPWKTPHVYLLPPQAAWQPESFKNRTYRAIEQRSSLPRTVLKGVFLGQVPFPRFQSNRNYAGIFNRVLAVPHRPGGLCVWEFPGIQKSHTGWPVDWYRYWSTKVTGIYPKTSTTVLPTHLSTNTDVDDKEILLAVGGGTGAGTGTGGLEMDRDIIRRTSGSTKAWGNEVVNKGNED